VKTTKNHQKTTENKKQNHQKPPKTTKTIKNHKKSTKKLPKKHQKPPNTS